MVLPALFLHRHVVSMHTSVLPRLFIYHEMVNLMAPIHGLSCYMLPTLHSLRI